MKFVNCNKLTNVVIQEGVTTLGNYDTTVVTPTVSVTYHTDIQSYGDSQETKKNGEWQVLQEKQRVLKIFG